MSTIPISIQGWGLVVSLLLPLMGCASASDLPVPFLLDLPITPDQATPAWLGQPETPQASFAVLNLPILTPDPDASLLVTVFFDEKEGGFMRVAWKGTQGAQLLSDNFYEGIGMSNQRSLLLSPATLVGDGILTFQCGDSALGIRRIKMEWLENKTGLVSSQVTDLLVTPARGATQSAQNFNGQPQPAEAAAWQNQIVTVPLADLPQRIEQGVEFTIDLDKVPTSSRLALKEAGLPLGQHLAVWINQQRAGTITPHVPDLSDEGFLGDAKTASRYVGWREASFFVPVTFLKAGDNTVQFAAEDDAPSSAGKADAQADQPLALKNIALELNYLPKATDNGSMAQSPTTSTLTGPIAPTLSSSTPSESYTP